MATAFIRDGKKIEVPRDVIAQGGKAVEKYLDEKTKPKTAPKTDAKKVTPEAGEESAGG